MGRKELIIAVLAAFCLTTTLFMALPTKSNPGPGEYDAWNDLNGDGIIDMYDAIQFAGTFNTLGDPTKNVNVTNWPSEPNYKLVSLGTINCSWTSSQGSGIQIAGIETNGFSRLYLYIKPAKPYQASAGTYTVTVHVDSMVWRDSKDAPEFVAQEFLDDAAYHTDVSVTNGQILSWTTQLFDSSSGLEIKGPYAGFILWSNATISSGWVMMAVAAYLRNE